MTATTNNNPHLKSLRQHVASPDYRPGNKSELARTLGIASKDRSRFREALKQLEAAGELAIGRKGRYVIPNEAGDASTESAITGTVSFSPNEKQRSAFFIPDPGVAAKTPQLKNVEGDLFIPGRYTANAMHGDRIAVKLAKKPAPRWHKHVKHKRKHQDRQGNVLEARIVKVIERRHSKVVGTYLKHGRYAHLEPDNSRLPRKFNLSSVLDGARHGDKVVAEFESWDSNRIPPNARMTEVLGRPDAPGVDILSIIHKHGLPMEFPKAVRAEAEAIDETITEAEVARREDWRDREIFTIDPGDAKDFDDAIHVEKFADGSGWELAVHIADVSHYVKPGSVLDREAKKRGNSCYLADRVIPMLPEKLSNGVCSLKPDVDRLTHAAILRFKASGELKSARFISAVIRSCRRFTYEDAFKFLELKGNKPKTPGSPEEKQLAEHLNRAWELAALLRKRRFKAGGLDLDFPEVRAVLNKNGEAIDVKKVENDESHQLIEEFMLAANEAVAHETKNEQRPSVYRVHEDPDPEKLLEFAEQARGYGYKVGDVTMKAELQKLLVQIRGKPEEHALKIGLLKSLKRAAYSEDPQGHYGLAKQNYTHFTSPIRRYADLIIHRVLRKIVSRRDPDHGPKSPDKTPSQGELASIAKHISETERAAADAEMESQRLKIIEYLVRISGKDGGRTFDAVVFDVRPIGAFVELTDYQIKGLIRKEDLPPNDYRFDTARQQFNGRYGKSRIGVGQQIRVKVARVDRERGFVDFVAVGG